MAIHAEVTDEAFNVTFRGWDRLWVFRRRVSIPIAEITQACVVPRDQAVGRLRWRLGGTHLPRIVWAGNWSLRDLDGRALVAIYRDPEVLEVTTVRWKPRLILLQHPDRHDLAWYLGERID